jgi:hypothetical protein
MDERSGCNHLVGIILDVPGFSRGVYGCFEPTNITRHVVIIEINYIQITTNLLVTLKGFMNSKIAIPNSDAFGMKSQQGLQGDRSVMAQHKMRSLKGLTAKVAANPDA